LRCQTLFPRLPDLGMSRTFITDLIMTLAHPAEAVNRFLWNSYGNVWTAWKE
jgi:hypothetical protein